MSHIPHYHPIRRKALPASYEYIHPSLNSEDEVVSKTSQQTRSIEVKSKPLRKDGRKRIACVVDCLCLLLCIAIFTFALLVYRANSTVMDSYQYSLLNTARIGTTAFPYLFALIIGRSIQSVLDWRLGHGIDVLSLAYLSKSSTLGATLITTLQLRSSHWLPLGLATIWTFSPFGSQAMLRFVDVKQLSVASNSTSPLQYVYPAASLETAFNDTLTAANSANIILLASLLSVETTLYEPQDTFGNLRIPDLNSLAVLENSSDWTSLPYSGNYSYSSLYGIPFTRPSGNGNMTFTLQSWYWTLDDATISQINITGSPDRPILPTAPTGWTNYSGNDNRWNFLSPQYLSPDGFELIATPPNVTLPLIFDSAPLEKGNCTCGTRLSFNLTHRPVEIQATCNSSSCKTTAVRNANFPDPYNSQWDYLFVIRWFLPQLTRAFPINAEAPYGPSAFEVFLNNTSHNPFDPDDGVNYINLFDLGADELAFRLEQVLNTYWIALSAGSAAATTPGRLNIAGFVASEEGVHGGNSTFSLGTVATFHNWIDFLHCDIAWLVVLCVATMVMLSATVVSIVSTLLYDGPEATGFISGLIRSYQIPGLEHGSYLDGDDLVRQLKGVELKIGDAKPTGTTGQIVIGPSTMLGDLERGRRYI